MGSEVTLFRHFGDKASLARAAVRRFDPAAGLDAYDPAIDASTAQAARAGLLRCLSRRWADLSDQQITDLLTARLRPLLRTQPATPRH